MEGGGIGEQFKKPISFSLNFKLSENCFKIAEKKFLSENFGPTIKHLGLPTNILRNFLRKIKILSTRSVLRRKFAIFCFVYKAASMGILRLLVSQWPRIFNVPIVYEIEQSRYNL